MMMTSIRTVRVAASSTRTCVVQGVSGLNAVRQPISMHNKVKHSISCMVVNNLELLICGIALEKL